MTPIQRQLLLTNKQWKTVVYDSFNRSDNAISMGNADTGQAWQVLAGTFGIISGMAYCPVPIGITVIDSKVSDDCAISINFIVSTNIRLVFRVVDASNLLFITTSGLFQKLSGVNTQLATISPTINIGDTVKVTCKGSYIGVYKNNIQVLNYSTSLFQDATMHGLYAADNRDRYENFKVEVK